MSTASLRHPDHDGLGKAYEEREHHKTWLKLLCGDSEEPPALALFSARPERTVFIPLL